MIQLRIIIVIEVCVSFMMEVYLFLKKIHMSVKY